MGRSINNHSERRNPHPERKIYQVPLKSEF